MNEQQAAERIEQLLAALREIQKGEGAFSRDQHTFACNVIENMKQIATKALDGTYERD